MLIQTVFDGRFRVSEAISLTPKRLVQSDDRWAVRFIGKGNKVCEAAISSTIVGKLLAYAYHHEIKPGWRFLILTATCVWQIADKAFEAFHNFDAFFEHVKMLPPRCNGNKTGSCIMPRRNC